LQFLQILQLFERAILALRHDRRARRKSYVIPVACVWHRARLEVAAMLHMALVFLVIGLISALLGFTTIAGASFAIAKFLAGLFLLLFLVFIIIAVTAARKIMD
jgi:uncharacterized membrane protein YtjA (UPF0391 family)